MTATIPPVPETFHDGVLDALVNHALVSILIDIQNKRARVDEGFVPAYNLSSCSEEALGELLHEIARDVQWTVLRQYRAELIENMWRIVCASPLSDSRDMIRSLVDDAIARARASKANFGVP